MTDYEISKMAGRIVDKYNKEMLQEDKLKVKEYSLMWYFIVQEVTKTLEEQE